MKLRIQRVSPPGFSKDPGRTVDLDGMPDHLESHAAMDLVASLIEEMYNDYDEFLGVGHQLILTVEDD